MGRVLQTSDYVCDDDQVASTMTINGTVFVTCVHREPTSIDTYFIVVVVGLFVFVLSGIIATIWFSCTDQEMLHNKDKNTEEHAAMLPKKPPSNRTVNGLRRWEAFVHESGYIRRIAQVLEMDDRIPIEVEEWLAEFEPVVWAKVCHTTDVVQRATHVIVELFKKEAETQHMPPHIPFDKWKDRLVDMCGGEWAVLIMEHVEKELKQG